MLRIGNKFRFSVLGSRLSVIAEHRAPSTGHAFTLIELLISVVILGCGLVLIIRSFSTSLSGLNSAQNYLEAMKLAKEKILDYELLAYEYGGLFELGGLSGRQKIGSREFEWFSEVREISGSGDLSQELVEVCVRLNWKEANINKDANLATYLPRPYEEYEEEEE